MRKINSWEYGYWWIEWGGSLNTIRDNERIRHELLSIVMGVWDYIKNSGDHPSSAKWGLDWVGMMPGKRGSRRLVGDYMLKQQDLMDGGNFEDAVAIGGWPMDDHPPGGFDRADLPPATQIRTPEVFNIPLRSLYSKNIRNLFMAGRNISATHVAFTSTRVMGTCAVIGQAAGTAIAKCLKDDVTPKQLSKNTEKVKELQQALLRDDQSIRAAKNEDALDLARQAKVTASAGDASLLLNGWTRDIPGKTPQVNQWSAPLASDGAWIELSWDKPQKIGEIQLTFDTGFKRELTLSSSNAANRGIVRAPQPETVRDYTVYYRPATGGDLVKLAETSKNHQRLNRHKFSPIEAQSVRIHVQATNGDENARIFEVRCYA
jgi:hypothetical protein